MVLMEKLKTLFQKDAHIVCLKCASINWNSFENGKPYHDRVTIKADKYCYYHCILAWVSLNEICVCM